MIFFFSFFIFLLLVIYLHNYLKFSHWKNLNVPFVKPHALFGNFKENVFLQKPIGNVYKDIYNASRECLYTGIYIIRRPGILVRDPELVRDILVKDFSKFHDNDLSIDCDADPIFGNNPFCVPGLEWKIKRALHSPHYTSGKIKSMVPLIDEGGDKLVNYLDTQIKKSGGKFCVNATDLTEKITLYNVASCALGIDSKSFDEENPPMMIMMRRILNPSFFNALTHFFIFLMPPIARFLTVQLIPHDVTQQFRQIISDTLKYRKENNIVRNDFLDRIKDLSADDILVQVGAFFLDGVVTNSVAMNFMFYELARNSDIQEKLRQEVDEVLVKHNGKLSYETLQDMPYLDAIVSESLRMYPPLPHMTRVCTAPYELPPANESSKPLKVEVGLPIIISILGLHYDEKYFPDPYRFNPERFLAENEEKIVKFTYLPFSEGPRICLGRRFALAQTKIDLVKVISKFEMRVSSKTKEPLKFDPKHFFLQAEGGVWVDFYRRKT